MENRLDKTSFADPLKAEMRPAGHSCGRIPGIGGHSREDWVAWMWVEAAGWESRTKPGRGGLFLPGQGGPWGCFVAGAPHKANHSLGIYIRSVRMGYEGLRWWRREREGLQESGERPELGQVSWKCKGRLGVGKWKGRAHRTWCPGVGEKRAKTKRASAFQVRAIQRGRVPFRAGSREVRVWLSCSEQTHPARGGHFPSSHLPSVAKSRSEWPPLTPLCLFFSSEALS